MFLLFQLGSQFNLVSFDPGSIANFDIFHEISRWHEIQYQERATESS